MIIDTEKQNCGNCAYWTDNRCLAATHYSTYQSEPIFEGKPESKIHVADGSEYFAALYTPADHVCAEWGKSSEVRTVVYPDTIVKSTT